MLSCITGRLDDDGRLHYYFADHLGTSDVITDQNGVIENESDYYPYGGEQIITQSLPDQNYKFNGKERDPETGLDYFGTRYFTSNLGRWVTPDWAAKPTTVPYANFGNPQSLNLYGYVENNPTTLGDPDGHQDADVLPALTNVSLADVWKAAAAGEFLGPEGALALGGTALSIFVETHGGGPAYPFYYHGEFDNGPPGFNNSNSSTTTQSSQSTQSAQTDQSTPAQPPEGGNGKYENSPENQQRMSQGKAPLDKDGKPIELHHEGQTQNGQLKEMTQEEHRGGDNFKKNHENTGQESSQINRSEAAKARRQALEEQSQRSTMTDLMLEAQGPDGLFAVFQEDEGSGYFFVYKPETQGVLAQIRIYEGGLKAAVHESDVQLMWSSDQRKCGIALWGQMRGVINIATGEETRAPVESDRRGTVDPEWLKGFEKDYLDQYVFVRSRQRYWKEAVKEQDSGTVRVRPEDETPPETNFIVYAIGPEEHAAVFEDEGETGYLYLYSAREQTVVRYLHIYDRSKSVAVAREDVQVQWSEDGTKCGVAIWGKMRGIIDVASDREGRVWLESRNTPGIGDREWLKGFRD